MAKKSVRFADDTASATASAFSSISDVDLNTLWIALGILLGLAVLTIVSMWVMPSTKEGFASGGGGSLAIQVPDHATLETTVSGLEPGSRILYWISGEAVATEKIKELNNLANITECSRVFLDGSQNAGVTEVSSDGIAVFRYRPFIPAGESVRLRWRVCSTNGGLGAVQESRI